MASADVVQAESCSLSARTWGIAHFCARIRESVAARLARVSCLPRLSTDLQPVMMGYLLRVLLLGTCPYTRPALGH